MMARVTGDTEICGYARVGVVGTLHGKAALGAKMTLAEKGASKRDCLMCTFAGEARCMPIRKSATSVSYTCPGYPDQQFMDAD